MNKGVLISIIILGIGIVAGVAWYLFGGRNRSSSNSTTQTNTGTNSTGSQSSAPGTGRPDPEPTPGGESNTQRMIRSNAEALIETITIKNDDDSYDVYSFDKDPNHFKEGDIIYSMKDINLYDDDGDPFQVYPMECIGNFKSRDLSAIFIENDNMIYTLHGINSDGEIGKLINS